MTYTISDEEIKAAVPLKTPWYKKFELKVKSMIGVIIIIGTMVLYGCVLGGVFKADTDSSKMVLGSIGVLSGNVVGYFFTRTKDEE